VDVLGHKDIAPQVVEAFAPTGVEGLGQPNATALTGQKCLSVETRERQTMGLAIDIVTLARFAMR
jgi:hypothetical protein